MILNKQELFGEGEAWGLQPDYTDFQLLDNIGPPQQESSLLLLCKRKQEALQKR